MEEKVILKRPPKSPGLAGVLAFFFPFTGALYNGQLGKFAVFLLTAAIMITTIANNAGSEVFMALLLGGLYLYQIYDAVHSARLINRRMLKQEVDEKDEIEEIPVAIKSGSVFWGIVLICLGGFLLLANFNLLSYTLFWRLLPAVVIVLGVKLIYDYARGN